MKRLFFIISLFYLFVSSTYAQCGIHNTAFNSGEFLSYDLYFNWKFIWVKAGTASMSTVKSYYKGHPAYRTSLITRGNKKVDKLFVLRDTLLSYSSESVSPLYYRKAAKEGDRYYIDEIFYSYPNGNCHLKQHEINNKGEHSWKEAEYKDCIYDMMSIFMRARNFDASKFRIGQNIPLPIADGHKLINSWLKYRGKENFTVEGTKQKYRCLVFSFIEREDGKNKEIVKFYITDDANHIPVRLDLFLNFGTAKAFLRSMKGMRNAVTSRVR